MTTVTSPSAPPTGDGPTTELHIAGAVNAALDAALSSDPTLLLLGEDIADPIGGVWKTFKGLSDKHGERRVRATPISETAIVGAAIGASLAGHRVVADIMFFDFTLVCADQIVNHAAKLRYMSGGRTPVPITITTTVGFGQFGAQHVQSLEALYMHTPGIKVVYPSTALDAKGLMATCLEDPDPCLFIQHGGMLFSRKSQVPTDPSFRIPLGRADVKRSGSDVTVVTYGPSVADVLAAAETLSTEGIDVEVVDLRSLVPLDVETVLASVARTSRAAVVHTATRFCGPGAEIASLITEHLFHELAAPVLRLGAPAVPVPFSPQMPVHPSAESIAAALRELVTGG